jgi:hypothetical protein
MSLGSATAGELLELAMDQVCSGAFHLPRDAPAISAAPGTAGGAGYASAGAQTTAASDATTQPAPPAPPQPKVSPVTRPFSRIKVLLTVAYEVLSLVIRLECAEERQRWATLVSGTLEQLANEGSGGRGRAGFQVMTDSLHGRGGWLVRKPEGATVSFSVPVPAVVTEGEREDDEFGSPRPAKRPRLEQEDWTWSSSSTVVAPPDPTPEPTPSTVITAEVSASDITKDRPISNDSSSQWAAPIARLRGCCFLVIGSAEVQLGNIGAAGEALSKAVEHLEEALRLSHATSGVKAEGADLKLPESVLRGIGEMDAVALLVQALSAMVPLEHDPVKREMLLARAKELSVPAVAAGFGVGLGGDGSSGAEEIGMDVV